MSEAPMPRPITIPARVPAAPGQRVRIRYGNMARGWYAVIVTAQYSATAAMNSVTATLERPGPGCTGDGHKAGDTVTVWASDMEAVQ